VLGQVAQELKKAATIAASGPEALALSLLLCNSTDIEVRFAATPSDLLLARVSLGLPPPPSTIFYRTVNPVAVQAAVPPLSPMA